MRRACIAVGLMIVLLGSARAAAVESAVQTATASVKRLSRSARVRFNRVEGLFAGYRVYVRPGVFPWGRLFSEAGVGLHNQGFRWESGFEIENGRFRATVSVFDRTETNDRDIIGEAENTFYSLLFKRDYRDYFRTRNGFEASGSITLKKNLEATGALSVFAYRNMGVDTDWGIFYPDRVYRPNPAVTEADAGRLELGLKWDSRRIRSPLFRNAWYVRAVYERGFRELPYNGLVVILKRYQKLVLGNQAIVLSGKLGTRESIHEQHQFDLGGIGTLRGFDIKEFTGNRMALFSVEYLFRGDVLGRAPIPGFQLLNLAVFLDTGWTAKTGAFDSLLNGFGDMTPGNFKTNAGAAVIVAQEWLRFDVARRLDRSSDAWAFQVRFMKKL